MAIPLIGTAVTIGATLRPRLAWAEGAAGVLVADRRHLFSEWTPAAPVAAAGDPGDVDLGAHTWVVVFVAAGLDHRAGVVSVPLTIVTAPKQVLLSEIQLGPTGTTDRKIFRTEAGGSVHKLVGTLAGNVATVFTDDVADSALGAPLDLSAKLGPTAKAVAVRAERVPGRYVTLTLPLAEVS